MAIKNYIQLLVIISVFLTTHVQLIIGEHSCSSWDASEIINEHQTLLDEEIDNADLIIEQQLTETINKITQSDTSLQQQQNLNNIQESLSNLNKEVCSYEVRRLFELRRSSLAELELKCNRNANKKQLSLQVKARSDLKKIKFNKIKVAFALNKCGNQRSARNCWRVTNCCQQSLKQITNKIDSIVKSIDEEISTSGSEYSNCIKNVAKTALKIELNIKEELLKCKLEEDKDESSESAEVDESVKPTETSEQNESNESLESHESNSQNPNKEQETTSASPESPAQTEIQQQEEQTVTNGETVPPQHEENVPQEENSDNPTVVVTDTSESSSNTEPTELPEQNNNEGTEKEPHEQHNIDETLPPNPEEASTQPQNNEQTEACVVSVSTQLPQEISDNPTELVTDTSESNPNTEVATELPEQSTEKEPHEQHNNDETLPPNPEEASTQPQNNEQTEACVVSVSTQLTQEISDNPTKLVTDTSESNSNTEVPTEFPEQSTEKVPHEQHNNDETLPPNPEEASTEHQNQEQTVAGEVTVSAQPNEISDNPTEVVTDTSESNSNTEVPTELPEQNNNEVTEEEPHEQHSNDETLPPNPEGASTEPQIQEQTVADVTVSAQLPEENSDNSTKLVTGTSESSSNIEVLTELPDQHNNEEGANEPHEEHNTDETLPPNPEESSTEVHNHEQTVPDEVTECAQPEENIQPQEENSDNPNEVVTDTSESSSNTEVPTELPEQNNNEGAEEEPHEQQHYEETTLPDLELCITELQYQEQTVADEEIGSAQPEEGNVQQLEEEPKAKEVANELLEQGNNQENNIEDQDQQNAIQALPPNAVEGFEQFDDELYH